MPQGLPREWRDSMPAHEVVARALHWLAPRDQAAYEHVQAANHAWRSTQDFDKLAELSVYFEEGASLFRKLCRRSWWWRTVDMGLAAVNLGLCVGVIQNGIRETVGSLVFGMQLGAVCAIAVSAWIAHKDHGKYAVLQLTFKALRALAENAGVEVARDVIQRSDGQGDSR